MLGKRPCLLRSTSSRSLLIPCEDVEGESAAFCNYGQVTEKEPLPTISAPCKIVIGFEIGAEKKPPSDVCESPRSVLDALALLPSQEKQQAVTRSPYSGLGSLLTAKSGGGVGFGVEAQIRDKEARVHVGSVAGSFQNALFSQILLREAHPDKTSLSMKLCHGHSKGTGKVSIPDLMESDIASWQSQVSCVLCVEDECLDTDISPLRSQALFAPPSQDMAAHCAETNISACQRRVLDACRHNGLKDGCLVADIPPPSVNDPWHLAPPYVSPRNATHNELSGVSYSPESQDAVDGCKNGHISTWQSEDECTDICIPPWKTQALHSVSLDVECEVIGIQQSIFSAFSPPSCPRSLVASTSSFLEVCAYCGYSLRLGKDIFMYRGDQAFCSAECRYQKIALDESKEKQGS